MKKNTPKLDIQFSPEQLRLRMMLAGDRRIDAIDDNAHDLSTTIGLHRASGVSQPMISRLLHGLRPNISAKIALRLALALGCASTDLLTIDGIVATRYLEEKTPTQKGAELVESRSS